jgi:hypothetical protein
MENTIHTLENLFKLSSFGIPQYQRAYAWETEPQLVAFIDDLRQQTSTRKKNPEKNYFLGTLLLHEVESGRVDVVDGQQRLTTSVIFIAAALRRYESSSSPLASTDSLNLKALKNYFIYNEIEERQKFRTIEEDNPFFRTAILGLASDGSTQDSPSSKRLKNAFEFFSSIVLDTEWTDLLQTLISAKVMVYSVSNPADATLIFELQNDRGKKLTELEALKSYLMHLVYLHSKNPDDNLREIQTQFAKIYRIVEALGSTTKAPSEDAILSYHCVSYLRWSANEWRTPKDHIKQTVRSLTATTNITEWVLQLVSNILETFSTVQQVLNRRDDYSELAELMLLDRMASFWPLVIKTHRLDASPRMNDFRLACRLMEVYAMRGYGISNLRADAGLTSLYTRARDFGGGGFVDLFNFLHGICHWYDIQNRFESGLDRQYIYRSNRRDVQYLLWRYENHMRSQPGKAVEKLSWRNYIQPADERVRLSLEHIAAQENPISKTMVTWGQSSDEKLFSEIALHRLGNLVIDSKSANSSKGKYDFSDKLEALSTNSTFLSQGELKRWASKKDDGELTWDAISIEARHSVMIDFALKTWDPSTYYTPSAPAPTEEQADEVSLA